jgi:anti-anti-sigma factor
MGIRCDEYDGICVLTPDGELAGDVVFEAQRTCEDRLSRPHPPSFVFNLGGCDFIDSAGLEMLCRVRRRADAVGVGMTLARPGTNVAKILEITRLAGRIDCHSDLAAAVSAAR